MKMKKVWALLVSLMLVASMALPVALAVSDDQGASAAAVSSEEGTPPAEEQVEQKEADPKPDAEPEQDDQESDSQEQDGKESGENQCTCGAAEGEAHAADCPLYEKPEADKADENAALYQKFLAAKTMEEANALYNGLSKEEVTAFRTWLEENNKLTALEQHLSAITPEGEPVTMPIVSFTKVGPLLAAPARRARMMRAAADQDDTGIVLNKSAKSLGNGNYQITLEAYATGASSTTISANPADIVLVLDVSGSMDEKMTTYKEVYSVDESENYYIYVDGSYQKVSYYHGDYLTPAGWYYQRGFFEYEKVEFKKGASDTNKDHVQFYSRVGGKQKKLDALKDAVNDFIGSVEKQSPDSSIAIVKFAGDKKYEVGNNTYYNGRNYTQIVEPLTSAKANSTKLKNAVSKLSAGGATAADYGMQHAQTIIKDAAADGKKKVVIMFTDGEPNHSNGFNDDVASDTIKASNDMKVAGTTVYTIGVFSGADGTPVSSWDGVDETNKTNKTNKYMHLVSSNYKNAKGMNDTGEATYPTDGKSYFLSAGSADELSSIFQQISQEVGGSTSNLDEKATIKDIVTPYFDMPTDPKDVKVYTAESKDSTKDWKEPKEFTEGKVTLDSENNTVSVSGFSYRDNWCGTSSNGFHNGKKLIIQFNVTAKDGFLGGNDVPTNKDTSGIYDKDGEDGKMIDSFKVPTVNVPIKAVTVTAEDKNVYLLGGVTTEQLKTGATVNCGNIPLDLSKANNNYGLADWQNKYVDITVEMKDKDGNAISTDGLKDLTADTTYTVSVAVKPKYDGANSEGTPATEQSGINTPDAKINVFKPELTFKDSKAYYGETVAKDFTTNKVGNTVWKHESTASTDEGVTMLGTEPTLDLTYALDADKVEKGKYTKEDAAVKATVTIGGTDVTQYTTFQHQNCDPACDWQKPTTAGDPAFLIHIKTCKLTISKEGGATDEPYVFNIRKDNKKYSEVTIWGNGTATLYELPVGTYTIQEDTGWSWRFTADDNGQATLSAETTTGKITCTNTKDKDKWINGFSDVKNNIFKKVATN